MSMHARIGAGSLLALERSHVHAAVLAAGEVHDAIDLGEQRVVLAQADVLAGLEARTALANEDRASRHGLAGEALDAKALRRANRGRSWCEPRPFL